MADLNQDPGRLNIRCNQGNNLSVNVLLKDPATGLAIDISGYTWDAKVDGTLAITIGSITGGLNLSLDASQTGGLSLGDHHWKLDRTNTGNERTWLAGDFTVFEYVP